MNGDNKDFDNSTASRDAGLNKIVDTNTGKAVLMSDPIDTPIAVLSAGEQFQKNAPIVIEDALTGARVELTEPEPVIIEDRLTGIKHEI